jgi:hypothetical protein
MTIVKPCGPLPAPARRRGQLMRKLWGVAALAFGLAVGGAQAATELACTITGAGHIIAF